MSNDADFAELARRIAAIEKRLDALEDSTKSGLEAVKGRVAAEDRAAMSLSRAESAESNLEMLRNALREALELSLR